MKFELAPGRYVKVGGGETPAQTFLRLFGNCSALLQLHSGKRFQHNINHNSQTCRVAYSGWAFCLPFSATALVFWIPTGGKATLDF